MCAASSDMSGKPVVTRPGLGLGAQDPCQLRCVAEPGKPTQNPGNQPTTNQTSQNQPNQQCPFAPFCVLFGHAARTRSNRGPPGCFCALLHAHTARKRIDKKSRVPRVNRDEVGQEQSVSQRLEIPQLHWCTDEVLQQGRRACACP